MDRKKKSILELTRVSLSEYKEVKKLPLSLMADNVRSAQNIGAMMRTSDAFLIKEMVLAGISATPPSAEISKTALGAEDSICWRYVEDAVAEARRLKEMGVKLLVLEQTHNSVSLQNLKLKKEDGYSDTGEKGEEAETEYMLIVGNEVSGVDQRIVDIADIAIEIPMYGIKHSLNVSVSAGIALWQLHCLLFNEK